MFVEFGARGSVPFFVLPKTGEVVTVLCGWDLLLGNDKVHLHRLLRRNADFFLPRSGFTEDGPPDRLLAQNIMRNFVADELPTLVPRNNLILPRRHVG